MPLTQIGESRLINLELVTTIETDVRAQHPDRTRPVKEQYVDNAVRVRFQGTIEPLHLFDAEAAALLKAAGYKAPPPVVQKTAPTPPPAPAPAPTATVTTK